MSDYPTDFVDCDRCDGTGEREYELDLFMSDYGRCIDCGGTGQIEVCANCYDEGCTVCDPVARAALAEEGK